MAGWVKLHRKILEWEWYDDHNTFRLFMTLLMMANHTDKKWRGNLIMRGSLLTSLDSLSATTGLSVQQIRTSLNKLILTGEITNKSTSRNRIITISKWDSYQNDNNQDNNEVTGNQQAVNKQVTTNKNEKNVENEKKTDTPLAMLANMNVDKKIASDWLKVRKTKKLAPTQSAFDKVLREAVKAGMTMNEAVKVSAENSWGGFEASWLEGKNNQSFPQPQYTQNEYQLIGGDR